MKVLVTGATGYVGTALCHKLRDTDTIIHALCRSPDKKHLIRGDHVRIFEGQLQDTGALGRAMEGCDQIYHLAAYVKIWSKDMSIYNAINVEATKNLLDLAVENDVHRVVMTSTAGVMGPSSDKDSLVTESTNKVVNPATEYERSKILAEKEAFGYIDRGLELVVVNPTRIYGPGPDAQSNSITRMIRLFRDGKWRVIPADGSSVGNYTYIDDVVNGHILAMEKGRSGERYILGGANISYNELFDLLRRLTGSRLRLVHIPYFILVSFARMHKFAAQYFGIEPLIVPEFVRKLSRHWSMSSQKAIDELGYEITPIEDGLTQTLKWLEGTED